MHCNLLKLTFDYKLNVHFIASFSDLFNYFSAKFACIKVSEITKLPLPMIINVYFIKIHFRPNFLKLYLYFYLKCILLLWNIEEPKLKLKNRALFTKLLNPGLTC